jgi:glutaredoxin 2
MTLAITNGSSKLDDFILDALPYIDDAEYDDTHRKFAMQMIEEEQKVYPKTKNYLKRFPNPDYDKFLTPRLKQEFERMKEKKVGNYRLISVRSF